MKKERAISYLQDKELALAKTQFEIADALEELRDLQKNAKPAIAVNLDPEAVATVLKADTDFKLDVKGDKGDSPTPLEVAFELKSDDDFITSVKGEKGDKGDDGKTPSAKSVAKELLPLMPKPDIDVIIDNVVAQLEHSDIDRNRVFYGNEPAQPKEGDIWIQN